MGKLIMNMWKKDPCMTALIALLTGVSIGGIATGIIAGGESKNK